MIKGLSEKRRLPRAGKIKLGVMVESNGRTFPRATDYFVCPDPVKAVFGDKPKELRIMLPVDDPDMIFPQSLKMYRSGGGLFCAGNGEVARRWSPGGDLVERTCPCEYLDGDKPQCKPTATLNFLLPDVKMLGVWQLTVHGRTSIISLNSCLDHFAATFGGLRGIPFLLKLEPQETQRHDPKKQDMVRTTIHVPRIDAPVSYADVFEYRRAMGGKVEVMSLPAAPVDEIDDDVIESEPASPAMGPSGLSTPDGAGAPAQKTYGWTVESCYRAAQSNGLTPAEYEAYLTAVYRSPDLNGGQIKEQGDMFEGAEAGGRGARDILAQTIRLKGKRR